MTINYISNNENDLHHLNTKGSPAHVLRRIIVIVTITKRT